MARCPDCNEVLINSNNCRECGWKTDGVFGAASERQCFGMKGAVRCMSEGYVRRGGNWWCGPCHKAMISPRNEADTATAKNYIQEIKDTLAKAKGPMAKSIGDAIK